MTGKRLRRTWATAVVVALLLPAAAVASQVVTASGSTSVAPLFLLLAQKYVRVTHHSIKFKLSQGGSNVGVSDVAAGRVSIGNSSRDQAPNDPGGLVFNKVARDAICIVSNPANHLANLSQQQIVSIFSGQVVNWSSVPGATVSGPIVVNQRTAASGTADAFQKIVMGKTSVTNRAAAQGSNGLVQQAVKNNRNAIGYVSLAFTGGTNPISYQGVACNLRNAKSGAYGAVRNFWMVTRGAPTGAARRFISWVQNSGEANRIISSDWVPIA